MPGNTCGNLFRITSFGESHGQVLGVVIDGCPAGFSLNLEHISVELARRRPGHSRLVSARKEKDNVELLSGVFEDKTTGAPLMFLVRNEDVQSGAKATGPTGKASGYEKIKDLFRPGHADFTYFAKYGHRDYRGGGRASARETVARVIAGAVAKQLLSFVGITIRGGVSQIGNVSASDYHWDRVEENEVRSLDPAVVKKMIAEIETARKEKDSVGGIVEVEAIGVPPGLGEPLFEKLDAALASALMSIPAVKGVEIGAGFGAASMRGSAMNDPMFPDGYHTNNHGGILGGLSSGAPVSARFAVKPTSSIPQEQDTVDTELNPQKIVVTGRHDPCIAIRAVPIGEAMMALVLVDFWLCHLAATGARAIFSEVREIQYGLKE